MMIAKATHRKFANKQHYKFFKNGVIVGQIVIDFKMSENDLKKELLEFALMKGADTIVLYWTAIEGFVNKEVHL